MVVLAVAYGLLYICHWFFAAEESLLTMAFHLTLIFIGVNLFFLMKADSGKLQKKHITKDRNNSLIGYMLELVDSRQFHKIEEMNNKYCYDCLILRSKHADHCKKCG